MSQLNDSRGWATRRGFLGLCAGVALGVVGGTRQGWAWGTRSPLPLLPEGCHGFSETPPQTEHPEPRPGIDASRVLTHDELADAPHAIPTFDKIREIPEIMAICPSAYIRPAIQGIPINPNIINSAIPVKGSV